MNKKNQKFILAGLMLFLSISPVFSQVEVFKGQEPAKEISTTNQKIDTLFQRKYYFDKADVLFSCDFLGGRLNKVSQKNDSVFTVLISAENYPINPSPWYAFYITTNYSQKVTVELTYTKSKHRYFPKISADGKNWKPVDSSMVEYIQPGKAKFGEGSNPVSAAVKVNLTKGDTLWLAANDVVSSKDVYAWMDALPKHRKIKHDIAGHSTYGKEIKYFTIGKAKKNKPSIVIISRQHPPEVTGYFAMQQFVDVLLAKSKLSRKYRKKFVTYVVPLMNPDGVDAGHWRHNAGGIDLNRDWSQQNQPEVKNVNHMIDSSITAHQSKILFFIDFHSTYDDIFYTNKVTKPSNLPVLIDAMLSGMEATLKQGKLNVRPAEKIESFVSKGYFYNHYNAESITYEVGDNTSRDIIELKGKVAALSFLKSLFKLYK